MRKILVIFIVVFFFLSLFDLIDRNEELRIRIIPNSDLESDLSIKEEVKEYTICYLKQILDEEFDVLVNNINKTIDVFEISLEKQFSINAEVNLDYHTLYNKTYNNNAVKNTNELTLCIIINEGKGSNWWGTVYPDFLKISSSEEYKYESLIKIIFDKIKGDYNDYN